MLRFEPRQRGLAVAQGEHYGYMRHGGSCVHRRTILYDLNETWVVVDDISGQGNHEVRLHWQAGAFAALEAGTANAMRIATPAGDFEVAGHGASECSLVTGRQEPPRGWLSRYYGEKSPAPSFAAIAHGSLPIRLVSVLSPCRAHKLGRSAGGLWTVSFEDNGQQIRFDGADPGIAELAATPGQAAATIPQQVEEPVSV